MIKGDSERLSVHLIISNTTTTPSDTHTSFLMDRAYGSPERVALGSSLGSSLGGYASRSTVSRPGVHSPGSPSPVSPHPAHPSPPAGRQNGSDTLELKLRIQQLRKTIDSSSSATRLSPSPGRAGSATHGGLLQSPPAADSASDREQLIKETERRRLLEIEKERIRGQQVDKLKNALETLREESSRDRAEAARVIKSLEADVRRAKSQSASPRREPSASADTREEEMQRTIASLRRELAQSDSHIKHLEEERTRDAQNAVVLQAGQDEAAAKTRSLQLDWEKERFALTEQMKDMREELSILKGEHARLEGSCEDRARQVEMETDGLKAALRASEEENSTERSQHAKTVEFLKAELQRMEDTVQEERSFSNGLRKELAERVERQVEHHEVELKQYDSPAREQTPEAEEKGGGGAVTPVKSDDKTVEADIVESVVQREEEEVPEMKEKVQIEEKPAKGEKKTVKANKAGAVMTGMVIILPILLVASLVWAFFPPSH